MAVAKVHVAGFVANEPELKQIGENQILEISLPVQNRRTDDTAWYRAALFGKRAAALAGFLRKGMGVLISGDLNLRTYQKKDGSTGISLEVENADVQVTTRKDEGDANTSAPSSSSPIAATRANTAVAGVTPTRNVNFGKAQAADDIPF